MGGRKRFEHATHFHVAVVQKRQRNVQKKSDAYAKLLFCSLNLLFSFLLTLSLPSRRWILGLQLNVNIFMRRTKLQFGSTWIKVRSSVGSDVELRMRRTNQLNQISSKFSPERGQIYIIIQIFNLLVWWSSHVKIDVFAPETIFRRSIRLKQTDRTCWTIQTQAQFRRRASAVPN